MIQRIRNFVRNWLNKVVTTCSECDRPVRRKDYYLGRVVHRSDYDRGTHTACVKN